VIFIDTGFLFALISENDIQHERVVGVFRSVRRSGFEKQILTTNYVVAETITLTRRLGHAEAVRLGERLYSERLAQIHWVTPDEERAAFEYFKRYKDKKYSFVDCLSFVVMEKLGIREALAVDSDFSHRFVAHPGPLRLS
jgi:predicted nucleic acid-binding protein